MQPKHFKEISLMVGSSLDFLTAGAICKKKTTSCGPQFFHLEGVLFVKILFFQQWGG